MKKILLLAMAFSLPFTLSAQYDQPVEIKNGTPFWYLYMEFSGSLYQIPEKIPILFQEVRKQQLQTKITGNLFGIYFNLTEHAAGQDTVWGLGFPIAKDTTVHLPLKKAQYHYEKIARKIHVGPYDTVGLEYNVMIPFIEEAGMEIIGPILEIWLDEDPEQVKPEQRRTEVMISVGKIKK